MKTALFRGLLTLLLLSGLWFAWWAFGRSPESQIRAAQAKLIRALEKRDWAGLEKLLAPGYTDAYGHTRETALQDGRKYLSGFFTLTIKTDQTSVQAAKGLGAVTSMIRFEGNGVGYSQLIIGHINQFTQPWVFHWSNPGRWPWNWQVTLIHNDQLRATPSPFIQE